MPQQVNQYKPQSTIRIVGSIHGKLGFHESSVFSCSVFSWYKIVFGDVLVLQVVSHEVENLQKLEVEKLQRMRSLNRTQLVIELRSSSTL